MQFKRKSSNRSCNTRQCGRIVGCVICLLLAACGFIVFNIQQQAHKKARQEALRKQQEEETLAKQRKMLQEQQKRLEEEQEKHRQEEEELAREKAAQDALAKERLLTKQREQYQEWREELLHAEQKMDSISKLVDSEEAESLDWASETVPKTLDGEDDQENEAQIEKIKGLVEEAEEKLQKLEEVME